MHGVRRDDAAKTKFSEYKLAISEKSHELAAGRTQAAGYKNYGHRMHVEGVLEQRRRAQMVRPPCLGTSPWITTEPGCCSSFVEGARGAPLQHPCEASSSWTCIFVT